MKYALGVDIGGTKVSITLGDSHGRILSKVVIPTLTAGKTHQCIKQIAETLNQVRLLATKGTKGVLGIGVGIPGPMDPKKGIVERSPHLRGWAGFPLKIFLERKLRLPVFITNDANAAAVGEKLFGEGREIQDFVYLTISTGIGGGIILGGKLLSGASFGAGEVGHTIIVPGGTRCDCGHKGCLEAYSSGTAIAGYVREQIKLGRRSRLIEMVSSKSQIAAEIVSLAAEQRDSLALEAFRRAGYFLGIGLANLINVLNPQMVILGGSVMKSSRFFWTSMIKSVRGHAWPTLHRACRIVKTRLGSKVGDLGALALVFANR